MKLSDLPKNSSKPPSSPVEKTLNFAEQIQYSEPQKAYDLAQSIFKDMEMDTSSKLYLKSLYIKSRTSWHTGRFNEAYAAATKLLECAQKIKNKNFQAEAYNILGNVNLDMDNLDEALIQYTEGLKLARISQNVRVENFLLNNIGEIYNRLDADDQAKSYYEDALKLGLTHGLKNGVGMNYVNLGEIASKSKNFKQSLDYIDAALEVFDEINDKLGKAIALSLKAKVFMETGDLKTAKFYLLKARDIQKCTGDSYGHLQTSLSLVALFLEKNDFLQAEKIALETLNKKDPSPSTTSLVRLLFLLAQIYERQGNYKMALSYWKKYHNEDSRIEKEQLSERLNHVRSQFKLEQVNHEKEIFRLKNVELKSKNKELHTLYESINLISKIGRDITSTLNLPDVFQRLYGSINLIMDASSFGISLYDEKTGVIEYPLFISSEKPLSFPATNIENKNNLSALCIRNRTEIFINDYFSEYKNYKENILYERSGQFSQSILYVPLEVGNQIIGSVTVQSYKKDAYTLYHMDMLKALASYISIAIQNARESETLAQEIQEREKVQNSLESLNNQLREMTYMDALTQIPNRRHFIDKLTHELNRAKRKQEPLSVILIDIDKFKEYNDNYGHTEGDVCLEKVASLLEAGLRRKTDFVARYGGDEFVAILPNTDLNGAVQVAESMRKNVQDAHLEHKFSNVSPLVSITLGIYANIPQENISLERVVQLADQSLYAAKAMGRNQVVVNASPIGEIKTG